MNDQLLAPGRTLAWSDDGERVLPARLTESETRRVLFEWNATQTDYPSSRCIHELFEEQVDRTPDAIAVAFQDQELTYRQLNRRANALAHHLHGLGAGPDVLIGICIEHSLEMMVGLLGILKAGSAYVPLDPAYPRERLIFMLEDSQVSIVLTQSWLESRLSGTGNTKLIPLDRTGATATERDTSPVSGVMASHLAYVIYTSGSTGTPKGVMIVHRGLVNYLVWCVERYQVAAGIGSLVHSSIAFDLTITGLLAPLLAGRTAYLLPAGSGIETLLAAWRQLKNLSLVKITPAHLQLLRYQLEPHEAPGRTRALIIGGENLLAESVEFWRNFAPETMLINEYGPTETVVGCCIYQVPMQGSETGAIPIGRPIANTQLYIVDDHGQPVPIGTVGELWIGGDGVARGYWRRPELTRERFIPDPFGAKADGRLYRTGDLARYRADGNIEFLGRSDDQVKIRGYRVELGETESVLRQHAGLVQATVVAREDLPGEKRLLAYVVRAPGSAVLHGELRQFLKGKLPEYMVPSAFVFLSELPLTPNGKVDRQALPPRQPDDEAGQDAAQPRDPLELQLTSIWQRLLGIGAVGVQDNFFDLGGDSLLAAGLFAEIERVCRIRLPLATLFNAPTIDQLAQVLRAKGTAIAWSSLVLLQVGRDKWPWFFIHPVGGNVMGFRSLVNCFPMDQPIYALQSVGLDDKQAPLETVEEMASHYISEIRRIQPTGPFVLIGHSFGGLVAYEMAQQLHAQAQTVELVMLDTAEPKYFKPIQLRALDHLQHLLGLTLREKRQYLLQRVNNLKARAARVFHRVHHKILVARGETALVALANVERANFCAGQKYRTRAYAGSAILFRATEQSVGTYNNPTMGWNEVITGGLKVYDVPGDHLSMTEEPHVRQLAAELQACIRRALDGASAS